MRRAEIQVEPQERRHFWHYGQGYLFGLILLYQNQFPYGLQDCGDNMNRLALDLLPGSRVVPPGADEFESIILIPRYDRPNREGLALTPNLVDQFRRKFWELTGVDAYAEKRGVLIVRRGQFREPSKLVQGDSSEGANRRCLTNYDEIAALAREFSEDVREVMLEDLSLTEQARHFSTSRVVIMQHGAAFFNTIFAPGAFVLEVSHNDYFENYLHPYGIRRKRIGFSGEFREAAANLEQLRQCLQDIFKG